MEITYYYCDTVDLDEGLEGGHIMVGDEVGVEAEEVEDEGEGDKGIVVFLRCTFILL